MRQHNDYIHKKLTCKCLYIFASNLLNSVFFLLWFPQQQIYYLITFFTICRKSEHFITCKLYNFDLSLLVLNLNIVLYYLLKRTSVCLPSLRTLLSKMTNPMQDIARSECRDWRRPAGRIMYIFPAQACCTLRSLMSLRTHTHLNTTGLSNGRIIIKLKTSCVLLATIQQRLDLRGQFSVQPIISTNC